MARNRYMVSLVFLTCLVMSFLANILGPIVPDIISSLHVSLIVAGFLAFAFFIAYGLMSIPGGFLVERFTKKPVMILAFLVGTLGSLSFVLFPQYRVAAVSLFVMGAGMATLQVAINSLLRVSGGEEHHAFNSALAQLVFGSASLCEPANLLLSCAEPQAVFCRSKYVAAHPGRSDSRRHAVGIDVLDSCGLCPADGGRVVAGSVPNRAIYCRRAAGSREMYRSRAGKPAVWMYFLAMFAYVGCEQGTADWISKFLSQYHGFDPHTIGTAAVSWFWGLLTAGCSVGMLLLTVFDSHKVLMGACVDALLCLSAALFGPARVSVVAFAAIGLFASVMWPIVGSLGLNSVAEYHGSFTGILNTGIMGGAAVPVIIGRIGDHMGLRSGLSFLYLTFGFVLSVSFWAKPLISDATISLKKATAEVRV